jgi:hypothetical protein
MSHSDNDDIWAESDDEEQIAYERNLAEKEWERLQEDHGNVGKKKVLTLQVFTLTNNSTYFIRLDIKKVL